MGRVTVVTIPDIPVMYLPGDTGKPIPEQASETIDTVESRLPSLKGRKCYGVVVEGQYRACVALREGDDPASLGLQTWIIPGGLYLQRKLVDWNHEAGAIESVIESFLQRDDLDPSRHIIEYYRRHDELRILAPVTARP